MILFKKANELKKYLSDKRASGIKTGFVPTMGALHAGHLSLIEQSKKNTDLTICSIFVNPTQFNDPKDFEKYPVTIEQDLLLLETAGCDVLFLPPVEEVYPANAPAAAHYNLGYLETMLEGAFRPGHFQGVCQVMDRLLTIVDPGALFMGRKDYQQCMVVNRLLTLKGFGTALVICPTLRETTGLAMSSRNTRLGEGDRGNATAIYKALSFIKDNLVVGTTQELCNTAKTMLTNAGFSGIDYIAVCSAETLEPVTHWDGSTKLVALAAAFLSGVRLIDNLALN